MIEVGAELNRKELLDVLISLPVEKKGALPALSKVLITAKDGILELRATDMETYGIAKMSGSGDFRICVDWRTLTGIIKNIEDERVEIGVDGNKAVIDYREGAFKLDLFPIEDLPEFPAVEEVASEVSLPVQSFIDGVESVIYAVAKDDEARPSLRGVYVHAVDDKVHFVASDGYRLALHKIDTGQETDFSALLPAKSLKFVRSALKTEEGEVLLRKAENFTVVESETFTFYIRELEGEFPDYLAVIPKEEDFTCIADVPPFGTTLKRVISAGALTVKIYISVHEDRMWISFKEDEVEGEEEIIIPYAKGEDIEIRLNPKYLYDFVSKCTHGLKLKFTSPDTAVVMESEVGGTIYVVMPMRL